MRPEYGFLEVYIFLIWALEKVKLVHYALATVGSSNGDNHACYSAGCILL